MEKYDGPGGTMENNQKFNVHVALSGTKVTFTLILRSMTRLSGLSRNEDLTFAVWSIVPNFREGRVLVKVTENYRSSDIEVENGAVRKHFAVSNADLKKVKASV
ncbi:uncharacterized protein MYCFIDRAFT_212172 [Pseudocercospora fijiensis CIRAD86]|uniref:Uncharacterized protein n=1 Tax=Pseudocercospora fijiensis (strain CIRAD86) TaxID=383855 RepID=M2YNG9_PSEFD|nr:uncharacterized protein MYCFIDRAFT_212172 [Pseudocercospora fijiensis CIRAD86]EME79240.1 hypothetical protein MYCFIDRAFT_212172 [Pseudocercospora fijiensis CIRAD86]